MASVTLKAVRKVYQQGGRDVIAVHGVDLEVADGELVVLVGPSGCGKSTTLRMVAGLESISSGEILIDGRLVNDVPANDRDIAMVFQSYALYPHMTAYDNMAFALKLRGMPKAEIDSRVKEAAGILGIMELLGRKPRDMSGGQRQRVAVGRAIVRHPRVFLFDEPLSNLDAKLRVQMRREIARLHQQLSATMLYVTHDQVEAMTLGDRIVVLDRGHVQQIDTPMRLYERPKNIFVAAFIGSPSTSLPAVGNPRGGTRAEISRAPTRAERNASLPSGSTTSNRTRTVPAFVVALPPGAMSISSGRIPSVTAFPTRERSRVPHSAPSRSVNTPSASRNSKVPAPSPTTSVPANRFIEGLPMNAATKIFFGRS